MELVDHPVDGMLEEEIDGEDLLELDLMEMEGNQSQPRPIEVKGRSSNKKPKGTKKLGVKRNAPLSINNKKFEVLRRGSPSKRSASIGAHAEGGGEKLRRRYGSNKGKDNASKHDGLMSKYSSHQYP